MIWMRCACLPAFHLPAPRGRRYPTLNVHSFRGSTTTRLAWPCNHLILCCTATVFTHAALLLCPLRTPVHRARKLTACCQPTALREAENASELLIVVGVSYSSLLAEAPPSMLLAASLASLLVYYGA